MPGRRDAPEPIGRRLHAQSFETSHCSGECEVTLGPHIWTSQRHQEIDVRSPGANSANLGQDASRGRIVGSRDPTQREFAVFDLLRETQTVTRLLSCEPEASKLADGTLGDSSRRHPSDRIS